MVCVYFLFFVVVVVLNVSISGILVISMKTLDINLSTIFLHGHEMCNL